MHFSPTNFDGPKLIELDPIEDQRGFFARMFCEREFAEHDLVNHFPQHSLSFNKQKGTIRGMHFQPTPYAEVKLVRCVSGAIFDVVVDIRRGSPTRGHWEGFELSANNRRQLYIPEGFAHGFQTLSADTEVAYQISEFHRPGAGEGFRFDDPAISISWPLPVSVISEKDLSWPPVQNGPT
jgi:dTDP-4-dehydrorhamnose 3,5-epimerase